MIFKFFKSASKDCQTWLPADYTYYKDLKGYFYETKINPIKNGFANLMFKVVIYLMRDMGPELSKGDLEKKRSDLNSSVTLEATEFSENAKN
jgi:hypothetical protein